MLILQQGGPVGHKPKGPLEALRPKLQVCVEILVYILLLSPLHGSSFHSRSFACCSWYFFWVISSTDHVYSMDLGAI